MPLVASDLSSEFREPTALRLVRRCPCRSAPAGTAWSQTAPPRLRHSIPHPPSRPIYAWSWRASHACACEHPLTGLTGSPQYLELLLHPHSCILLFGRCFL